MNKKIRSLMALVACFVGCISLVACGSKGGAGDVSSSESVESSENVESSESVESEESSEDNLTENEIGPKASVSTATAEELATFNAEGIQVYNLNNFQTTGETVTLETAYIFSVTESLEDAKAGDYAEWIADYYVSVDTAVEAGSIGLAGSYEGWDNGAWVAFYSPIDLAANQEIGLLESTGGNPWTYAEVVEFVGTFRCGAFDLDDACAGVTLTVELRLTNPDDATDCLVITRIQYTFA